MVEHMHELKNEEMQGQFRAIFDECKAGGDPVRLKIEGLDDFVVLDYVTYQNIMNLVEELDTAKSILEGIKDMEEGRLYPAESVLREMREKYGI